VLSDLQSPLVEGLGIAITALGNKTVRQTDKDETDTVVASGSLKGECRSVPRLGLEIISDPERRATGLGLVAELVLSG
jgi:hypothetical protein